MNRADWQQIADERLLATAALLAAHNWPSAYYLAGYVVECALKSCILRRVASTPEMIFLEKRFSEKCWTHEAEDLMKLAGLEGDLASSIKSDSILGQNWEIVKDWNEKTRYSMKTQPDAEGLYEAIANNSNGILQWIRARW